MKSIDVKGTLRTETGKKATAALRKQGGIPCNLYGEKKDKDGKPEAVSFSVTADEVRNLVYSPDIFCVNLNIDGKECKAVMRELLDIDVTELGLGKTIKVGELSFEGLEMVTSPSVVVCQVKMTRNAKSAAAAAEA